jgi:hypothetical protein
MDAGRRGPRFSVLYFPFRQSSPKATLHFQTAVGSWHRHELPAPKSAIFHRDQVTVNAGHPDVQALVDLILAHAVSRAGTPSVQFSGGQRTMR